MKFENMAHAVEKSSLAALLQKAQTLTYVKYASALNFFRAALLSISVRARSSPNGEWVASEVFERPAEKDSSTDCHDNIKMIEYVSAHYPDEPGVYLMRGEGPEVLYVGKAKSLRKRVGSYFRNTGRLGPRIQALVARVREVEVRCTQTEKEALLLEAELIKKHRPRYNIVLRDDKSFLLFRLDPRQEYPRLVLTRRVVHDGSHYFGPFTSALAARRTWKMVNRLFRLRKCKDRVFANRIRPCLQHHMGRCLAPCVHPVSSEQYKEVVRKVELFLSGRTRELLDKLGRDMRDAAARMEFERAAHLRDQMEAVRSSLEDQAVVLTRDQDMDVLGMSESAEGLGFCVLFIRKGRLIDQKGYFWSEIPADDAERWELIQDFLLQFALQDRSVPERIVVPVKPGEHFLDELLSERSGRRVHIALPRGRQERQLMHMAEKNAAEHIRKQGRVVSGADLGKGLKLSKEPWRIEGVDVSHLSGTGTYAGVVVFEGGKPRKEEYRLYKFAPEESGGDDTRTLYLWMQRRIRSGPPWPDLILVDGGLGQLGAVMRALEEHEEDVDVEVASIAKSGRSGSDLADRVFRPGRKNPLGVKPGSPELLFLQQVRNETHRFVIGAQRRSRKKGVQQSSLVSLPGIGPATARQLMDHFTTLDRVLAATKEELEAVEGFGRKKAERVHDALQAQNSGTSPE
ncbi:MAG: excinuclease ABC subunit UvrC [Desulfovibrionales bacterium]